LSFSIRSISLPSGFWSATSTIFSMSASLPERMTVPSGSGAESISCIAFAKPIAISTSFSLAPRFFASARISAIFASSSLSALSCAS